MGFFCVGVWWVGGEKYKYKYNTQERGEIYILYRERGSAFYFSMVNGFTV